MAVLMCVNFTACSEDDPTDEEGSSTTQPSDEKKLVKIIQFVDGRLESVSEFKYGLNGRIAEYQNKTWFGGDNPDQMKYEYNWYSNDSITAIRDGELSKGFKLSEGKIVRETNYYGDESYCYIKNLDKMHHITTLGIMVNYYRLMTIIIFVIATALVRAFSHCFAMRQ